MMDAIERSRMLYESAVFGADPAALDRADQVLDQAEGDPDTVPADLALARGRILHGRFLAGGPPDPRELALFERALTLYAETDDEVGRAQSSFWIGCYHQVVGHDETAAGPALETARELSASTGQRLTLSYALRHLGIAAQRSGRLDEARALLEESTQLRRERGFWPGVAANLVGLAYVAAAQGRGDDARELVGEAARIVDETESRGLVDQVDEARATV